MAGSIGTLTRSLVDMGSQLQDASDKLGVSAEQLQVLKFAAEQTGTSFDALQTALAFNTKLVGNASRGNKEASASLKLLGLSAEGFVNVPIDRRLSVIADRLQKVSDPAQRLDLAIKVLGRSAGDLVPLLSQGAAGLAKFEEQLRSSNSILSNEQVKALDDAGDAWDAFVLRLKVNVAPAVTETIGFLEKLRRALTNEIEETPFDRALRVAQQGTGRGPAQRGNSSNRPFNNALAGFGAEAFRSSGDGQSVASQLKVIFDEVDKAVEASTVTLKAAAEERQKVLDEVTQLTEANRTPQETYFAGLDRVAELQRTAGLSAEVASRQILALGEAYATAQQKQYAGTETGRAYLQSIQDAEAIIQKVITPFEAYGTELERINRLTAEGLLSQEQSSRAVKLAGQDYADAQIAISKGNDQLSDSTERLLKDIKSAADGFAKDLTDVFFDSTQSIGEMFENLAETIAKALFTQTITQPLIDSILGSFGGSGLGSLFGGSNAMGGPISGGKAYLVGERGPELFVPGPGGGQIVPEGGAGSAVQVNLTITSVDPQTAAQTIASQERLITGMIRKATLRAGRRPSLA